MTTVNRSISYGFEPETGEWFAYAGARRTIAFAQSTVSQEDALIRLCNVLVEKIDNVDKAVAMNIDDYGLNV